MAFLLKLMAGGWATAKLQVAVCFFSSEESPAFPAGQIIKKKIKEATTKKVKVLAKAKKAKEKVFL